MNPPFSLKKINELHPVPFSRLDLECGAGGSGPDLLGAGGGPIPYPCIRPHFEHFSGWAAASSSIGSGGGEGELNVSCGWRLAVARLLWLKLPLTLLSCLGLDACNLWRGHSDEVNWLVTSCLSLYPNRLRAFVNNNVPVRYSAAPVRQSVVTSGLLIVWAVLNSQVHQPKGELQIAVARTKQFWRSVPPSAAQENQTIPPCGRTPPSLLAIRKGPQPPWHNPAIFGNIGLR